MTLPAKPKAYSYIRMSTEKQLHGDSLRRQLALSVAFADENGFELDTSYQDIGISAFSGDNLKRGALGRFIEAVELGDIPQGTHLLIESLDRLSREQVATAFTVFNQMLAHGIVIVTLADGNVYSASKTDLMQMVISIMLLSRGHEESAMKQKRVAAAWSNKRDNIAQEKLTRRAPGWLKLDADRRQFTVDPERAEVVRRIFTEVAGGVGKFKLARRLNEEKVAPFGRGNGWHPSAIQKLVHNHSVLGAFQPHRMQDGRRTPVGDPVPDYFPPIVDEELFLKARVAMQERRNGAASGRKGRSYSNLFGGIGRCAHCFGSMNYRNKGAGSKGGIYLTCSNAQRGNGCKNNVHFDYAEVEEAILRHVPDFELPRGDATKGIALAQEVAKLTVKLEASRERAQRLLDEWEASGSDLIRERLRERESEIADLSDRLKVATAERSALKANGTPEDRARRLAALSTQMAEAPAHDRYLIRAGLALALRRVVEAIVFDDDRSMEASVMGGVRAYRIKGLKLVAVIDEIPSLGQPGAYSRLSFTHGCPRRESRLDEVIRRSVSDLQAVGEAA